MSQRTLRSRRRRWRRLRRSPAAWWGLTVVAAATAAVVVWSALSGVRAELAGSDLRSVVVVTRTVEAGRVLASDDVTTAQWPGSAVPAGTVATDPVGRAARVDLHPGEALLEVRLAPVGARGLGARLPPGSRGVGVPLAGHTVPLDPGDRVDLVAPRPPGPLGGAPGGTVLATGVPVLEVHGGAVVVAVATDDVPALVGAIAAGPVEAVVTP